MRNYIKSEFYRILHTKEIYCIAGTLTGLSVFINLVNFLVKTRYATTSFSYSCLVANPMLFAAAGTVIAYFLYEGNKRNGTLKNAAANGISRTKLFAGECIVSILVSTFIMLLTLTVWILSTELLLEKTGPVKLKDLLSEVPAVYFISAACVISALFFLECFEKNITGILVWAAVWFVIPRIILLLGMHYTFLFNLAMWLPQSFFSLTNGNLVNMSKCITAWDSLEGMARCIISGAAGILIFTLSGAAALRRRDL